MEEIPTSKFRKNCSAILERVRKTRKPVRVTRFGEPLAEIVPASRKTKREKFLGGMVGTGRVVGDIVSPASNQKDWDVLRS